jgi:glycosyltransferase involved in cell wall biosynthesis
MELATEVPLYALLRRMDCHLTASRSTVVTEAAALGLPSVACGSEAPDFYQAEMAAGLLAVATTGAEIGEALRRALGTRRPVSIEPPKGLAAMRRLLEGDVIAEPGRAPRPP